jgi:hypothetical protein
MLMLAQTQLLSWVVTASVMPPSKSGWYSCFGKLELIACFKCFLYILRELITNFTLNYSSPSVRFRCIFDTSNFSKEID